MGWEVWEFPLVSGGNGSKAGRYRSGSVLALGLKWTFDRKYLGNLAISINKDSETLPIHKAPCCPLALTVTCLAEPIEGGYLEQERLAGGGEREPSLLLL